METDFRGYNTEEVSRLIDLWIFSEIKRKMLKEYLLNAKTIEDVGDMYGYSARNASTIINEGKNIVFSHMYKRHNTYIIYIRRKRGSPIKQKSHKVS
jgi:hypothetical protein